MPASQASPAPGDIRQRAHDILGRAEFVRHESLVDRVVSWIGDLLDKVSFGVAGGPGFIGNVVSLLILAGIVTLLVLLVRALLRNRRPPKPDREDELTIELEAGRPATDWRSDAERFEAGGQWREAMRARYRELVRSLIDAGVLADIPGRTTGEFRVEFGRARPSRAPEFDELTELFELVWYGGAPTDAADNERFRRLARAAIEPELVSA